MKKTLQTAVCVAAVLTAGPALALSVDLFNLDWSSGKREAAAWLKGLGGSAVLLETFDGSLGLAGEQGLSAGWYPSLDTAVGTFQAGGAPGTGATSYQHNGGIPAPYFQVKEMAPGSNYYGRTNTTSGGAFYLDSGDITQLTLSVAGGLSNLFFMIQDPSEWATTLVRSGGEVAEFGRGNADGSLWFVGISSATAIDTVTWTVLSQSDGYGLDNFGTVAAPVPEPKSMLLLGSGLLGLAGYCRRRSHGTPSA